MNMPMKAEAAEILARFVAETSYDTLPEAARVSAKRCLLDTLGVTAAASTQGIGHKALSDMIAKAGGARRPASSALADAIRSGSRRSPTAPWRAAVDFDDGHDESMTHPSAVVVSAALAMAERQGGVDGRRLITAIALGNEILVRLGLGIARRPGGLKLDTWFPSSVFGAFGGTAACASILGLTRPRSAAPSASCCSRPPARSRRSPRPASPA
jgi:2-methylcitrate dehydratase PrpD